MRYFFYIKNGDVQKMMMSQHPSITIEKQVLFPSAVVKIDKTLGTILDYQTGSKSTRVPFVFSEDTVEFPVSYEYIHIEDKLLPADFTKDSYVYDKTIESFKRKN